MQPNRVVSPTQPALPQWDAPTHPRMRRDLVAKRNDANLCELRVRGSPTFCLMYDFELVLASKMDGKRSLEDLAEAARKLALPAGIAEIQKFVRQMAAYGFIENAEPLHSVTGPEPWLAE